MQAEQNTTKPDNIPLNVIDAKLALLLIESPASTDQELAEKLGISRQTVNRRRKSKGVQKLFRSILAMPEREVRRILSKALARLESMLDNEDPRIQLAAAIALLKLGEGLIGNEMSLGY
jgi:hypothetical protein